MKTHDLLDLGAVAVAAGFALTMAACTPYQAAGSSASAPPPLPTYRLDVVTMKNGELYADTLDHGMSATDCMIAREPYTLDSGLCSMERSPTGDRLPYLIGLGCYGFEGPVYGNEEDDFPICEAIGPTTYPARA